MRMYHSYPEVFSLYHKQVRDIFSTPVVVEEKVDGSQFSFYKDRNTGTVHCFSKNVEINLEYPQSLFKPAVEFVLSIQALLTPGYIYRGECISKEKHNVIKYSRTPRTFIVGFDIDKKYEDYLSPEEKLEEFNRLGIEVVPVLYSGVVSNVEELERLLDKESFLGGSLVEGVVIKNYNLFGADKKILVAKIVSDKFKEVAKQVWSQSNIVKELGTALRTEARWQKAVIHLKERGLLEGSPRDIPRIIDEVLADVRKEEYENICEALFNHYWKDISREIIKGIPEWYKNQLG